jgi:hypothetical protein
MGLASPDRGGRRQSRDAEGMASRVEKYVPARVILPLHQGCTKPNRGGRRGLQIRRGCEVEVHYGSARPLRLVIRRHSLGHEDDPGRPDADAARAVPYDLAAEKLSIKRPKLTGIGAIERNSGDPQRDHQSSISPLQPDDAQS